MTSLLGLRVQNFGTIGDVRLGQVGPGRGKPLRGLVCLIGPHNSGKSTLLDVFRFLADCLMEGVETACNKPHRGGYDRIHNAEANGPMSFQLYYREWKGAKPITYELVIDTRNGRPVIASETLLQRRRGSDNGPPRPFAFLELSNGIGKVWPGEAPENAEAEVEEDANGVDVNLANLTQLGIMTFGRLKEYPRISRLQRFIEAWYQFDFVPEAARSLPPAGAQPHLDRTCANLANYARFISDKYPRVHETIVDELTVNVPHLWLMGNWETLDKRQLLHFHEGREDDPSFPSHMSDGTLKLLAYLLLFKDPKPRSLMCIDLPESHIYPLFLFSLVEKFREYMDRGGQLFISTHSPTLVNALLPDEVFCISKEWGINRIRRVADNPKVMTFVKAGETLGSLWQRGLLGGSIYQ